MACDNAREVIQIFIGLEEAQVEEYLGDGRFRINLPPTQRGLIRYRNQPRRSDQAGGCDIPISDCCYLYEYYLGNAKQRQHAGVRTLHRGFDFVPVLKLFCSEQATDVSVSLKTPFRCL